MSTVSQAAGQSRGGIHTGLKVTSAVLTLGMIVQAWLGGSGFFEENRRNLVDVHARIGDVYVLVTVAQIVLAYLAMRGGQATSRLMVVSILILIAVVVQLFLGYERELAWHLPNGVLLMGLCMISLVQVWGGAVTRD